MTSSNQLMESSKIWVDSSRIAKAVMLRTVRSRRKSKERDSNIKTCPITLVNALHLGYGGVEQNAA